MSKIELKKELKEYYEIKKNLIQVVHVPTFNYLRISGEGNPNTTPLFGLATEALFSISYKMKFKIKKDLQIDYSVMPLQGLWWTDKMEDFSLEHKENWKWELMILQPHYVTEELLQFTVNEINKVKANHLFCDLILSEYAEGLVAQILHMGPYSEEAPTVQKLHDFITQNGYTFNGKHHEIYLGDPRKAKPETLKTIIRQPITPV